MARRKAQQLFQKKNAGYPDIGRKNARKKEELLDRYCAVRNTALVISRCCS